VLHPVLVAEILDAEIDAARKRLGSRIGTARRDGMRALVEFNDGVVACFDGAAYDAEPYAVSFVNGTGTLLGGSDWPAGINHGDHPILHRPFVCIRGTAEYHAHPSHLRDRWDLYRGRITLADLLDHICNRLRR
jgi:putative metal binding uncharacterized protein